MNEAIFLGACPVVRPEGIYLDGVRVIRLGLHGTGLNDAGDLFAYRSEWEPFIKAHLDLWRDLNDRFENPAYASKCPPGIFDDAAIRNLDPTSRSWCATLALTRMMTSTTDPRGILPRWNAWKDKSSSEIIAGAPDMLRWLQNVVMQVGGSDKDRLLALAKTWGIDVKLPDLPSFDTQSEVIARMQGAYTTTKGILQILGYGAGETIQAAGDVAQATSQGLKDTAKALPATFHWAAVAFAVTVAFVGGALLVYYVPRRDLTPVQS